VETGTLVEFEHLSVEGPSAFVGVAPVGEGGDEIARGVRFVGAISNDERNATRDVRSSRRDDFPSIVYNFRSSTKCLINIEVLGAYMHTSEELVASEFEYRADGRSVSREDVMPTISPEDRVGVVMGSGSGGIAAGNFILSCVTAFYDHLRGRKTEFLEYPDYYTIQATSNPADYRMLDIYPAHKNVTVESDAERILQAITDRAITILLVPDAPPRTPEIQEITRRGAERRIEHCYMYAREEQLEAPDFVIQQPRQPAGDWYETTIDSLDEPPATNRSRPLTDDETPLVQGFRRIQFETALAHLPTGDGA
jgi:hypothetical protein